MYISHLDKSAILLNFSLLHPDWDDGGQPLNTKDDDCAYIDFFDMNMAKWRTAGCDIKRQVICQFYL